MRWLGLFAGAALLAACNEGTVDPPVIDDTAVVAGIVYLDIDGNERLNSPDEPVEGIRVRVTLPSSGLELAVDTTDEAGEFFMPEVPVGTVEVDMDPASLGDTLLAVPRDSIRYTLGAESALGVAVGVTFPQLDLAEVRAADPGRRVFTQGVVVASRGLAPGGAIHVEGDSVALRVLVPPSAAVAIGDSVRILGRTGSDLGQPALSNGRVFRVVAGARDVTPRTPTMGEALNGADGLDAALVEFTSGTVLGQETVAEGYRLEITDGADTLGVRLRTEQGFFGANVPEGAVILRLRGLLVPDPDLGVWDLVPRATVDVRLDAPPPPTAGSR